MGIHETINNNQENLKHEICFELHPLKIQEHSIQKHPT